jgi:hypothetical protein
MASVEAHSTITIGLGALVVKALAKLQLAEAVRHVRDQVGASFVTEGSDKSQTCRNQELCDTLE